MCAADRPSEGGRPREFSPRGTSTSPSSQPAGAAAAAAAPRPGPPRGWAAAAGGHPPAAGDPATRSPARGGAGHPPLGSAAGGLARAAAPRPSPAAGERGGAGGGGHHRPPRRVLLTLPLPAAPLGPPPDFLLALDRLQDPGNLGTLNAHGLAAGVGRLWLGGGADPLQPKVLRASAGAALALPLERLEEEELRGRLRQLRDGGFQVVATLVAPPAAGGRCPFPIGSSTGAVPPCCCSATKGPACSRSGGPGHPPGHHPPQPGGGIPERGRGGGAAAAGALAAGPAAAGKPAAGENARSVTQRPR